MGDGFVCNRAVSLVVTAYHMNEVPATRMTTDTEDIRHGSRMGITSASAYVYVRMYVWCVLL